jgi:hypothetical protein
MAAVLMIVARDRPDLFASLTHAFANDRGVAVILDRRCGERRHLLHAVTHDQRHADRRQARIDDDLNVLGWAAVRAG